MRDAYEQQRLRALARYQLMDADISGSLEGLAQLAAHSCEAPIGLVNLIGARRQVTKASHGLDLSPMPRKEGVCHYTIRREGGMVVEDLRLDKRFQGHPFVEGAPYIRFYAGMPVRSAGGHPLGTVCLLGYQPRGLSGDQRQALELIAGEVSARLDHLKATRERNGQPPPEVLLGEMHHRIKNNLTVLYSFLQMQRWNTGAPAARQALEHSMSRVKAMATVQDMLGGRQEGRLDFKVLAKEIIQTLQGPEASPAIRFHWDIDPIDLPSDQAIPCGLIMNELITNAYQHLTEEVEEGHIYIALKRAENAVTLQVRDDGAGLGEDAKPDDDALGLTIVKALAGQLGSDLEYQPEPMTTFSVRFEKTEAGH